MNWADRFAIFGGADPKILKDVPGERQRFIQMALVFLGTSGLAGVSMWFALTTAVLRDWPSPGKQLVSGILALLWAGLILNIDRFLTTTMNPTDSHGKLLAKAVPRVVMAGVIGLVVSTPLVLQVFRSDITAQMTRIQAAQSAANKELIASSDEQKNVTNLEAQITDKKAVLSGTPSVADSPAVKDAQRNLKDLEAALATQTRITDQASLLVVCEEYGFTKEQRKQLDDPGKCSAKPGINGPFDEYERDHQKQQAIKLDLQKQVESARRAVTTAKKSAKKVGAAEWEVEQTKAGEALPGLEEDLANAKSALDALRESLGETNRNDAGLLAQLKALDAVGQQASILRWSHLLIALLFFLIEILPVVAKILICWGPLSAYDEVAELRDEEIRDKKRIQRDSSRQIEQDKANTQVKAESDMRSREFAMAQKTNQFVADEMETVMRTELSLWAEGVTQAMDDLRNGQGQPGGGSQGTRKPSNMDPPDDLDPPYDLAPPDDV